MTIMTSLALGSPGYVQQRMDEEREPALWGFPVLACAKHLAFDE